MPSQPSEIPYLSSILIEYRYNANVKELQDTAGSEYFKFLSRKAHEGASNQAKIDVANAQMIGNIGRCSPALALCFVSYREPNDMTEFECGHLMNVVFD